MAELYVVKRLDNQKASPAGFQTKKEAKQERDRLTKDGTTCVVSRGAEHPHGASRVDPRCLNSERTSRKRKRIKHFEMGESS